MLVKAKNLINIHGDVMVVNCPYIDPVFFEGSLLLLVDLDVFEHQERHLLLKP